LIVAGNFFADFPFAVEESRFAPAFWYNRREIVSLKRSLCRVLNA